jgi:hypothetical protein
MGKLLCLLSSALIRLKAVDHATGQCSLRSCWLVAREAQGLIVEACAAVCLQPSLELGVKLVRCSAWSQQISWRRRRLRIEDVGGSLRWGSVLRRPRARFVEELSTGRDIVVGEDSGMVERVGSMEAMHCTTHGSGVWTGAETTLLVLCRRRRRHWRRDARRWAARAWSTFRRSHA